MENINGELEDFLDEIGTHVSHNPATHAVSGSSNHPHSDMVVSALNEVVSWAENQNDLYQLARYFMLLLAMAVAFDEEDSSAPVC